jgi:hypothetical protein
MKLFTGKESSQKVQEAMESTAIFLTGAPGRGVVSQAPAPKAALLQLRRDTDLY